LREELYIYIYIQRPRYSTKTKQQKRHTLTSLCNEIRVYKLYSGTGRPRIGEGKDNKGQRKTKTETLNWTCSKLSRDEGLRETDRDIEIREKRKEKRERGLRVE
jgi:hypothetical protein